VTSRSAAAAEGAAALAGGGAVPRHVAIIMDGNGRWAKQRCLPRAAGHKAGAEAVRRTLQAAADAGVEVLTLYAFSSENWRRSDEEISDLTGLMRYYVKNELQRLIDERVRLRLIGDYRAFGPEMTRLLENALEKTRDNDRLTLVVALNYGSRQEIASSAAKAAATGEVTVESIAGNLDTAGLPELDLLVRTSGEVRLSNFLLWQSAYAELLFIPTLWPDFDEKAFNDALEQFAARQRRFGGR
jgi:undecaprenyl diphosphate synthase